MSTSRKRRPSGPPGGGQYTVLRIKRKATDAPLSSLVISGQRERKRRDLGGGARRGVFRLAETVPHTWKGEGEEGEVLKTRIEGLLRSADGTPTLEESGPAMAGVSSPSLSLPQTQTPPPAPQPSTAPVVPTPLHVLLPAPGSVSAAPRVQYRVVTPARPQLRDPGLPPRVITLEEIEKARAQLLFVDAMAVEAEKEDEDSEVAAFLPMLKEYLKMEHDGSTPPPRRLDDDEYVYDLYYRDLSEATAGDTSSGNVGALLGYEDLSPPSTPPESEPEDEADEDSNDEDYYRNDYPEDEDADEDMEGFEDAYSDGEWSRDSEHEEDERGVWDYR